MSREFNPDADYVVAEWADGSVMVDSHGIAADEIPAFVAWLQEGPPKKRYRITKTFDFKPASVYGNGNNDLAYVRFEDSEEICE